MPKVTRRQTLSTLAGAGVVPSMSAAAHTPKTGGIQFSELFAPGDAKKIKVAKQVGVNNAIVGVARALGNVRREEYVTTLRQIKDEFAQAGLAIVGVESHPVDAEKIKLGVEGRDEQIENYTAAIAALAQVGIPMVCYNFMAGL